MAKKGDLIKIPLKTEDAIRNLMKVKPTAAMPRPSMTESKMKSKRKKK